VHMVGLFYLFYDISIELLLSYDQMGIIYWGIW